MLDFDVGGTMTAKRPALFRVATTTAMLMLTAVVFLATWSSPAQSKPEYLSEFNAKYDTRGGRLDSCQTCHNSATGNKDNVNPYGVDYGKNNHDFAAVEGLDSDGDGFSNLDEIKAETFPGDPKENPGNKPAPPPPPSTTTTTTAPGPLDGLPKLPLP